MIRTLFITISFCLISLSSHADEVDIRQVAEQYFAVYAARTDFKGFMDFYHDSVVLEDMIYGNHITNKGELAEFFNWADPKFTALEAKNLEISSLIVDGNKVVATGHFNRFIYGKEVMGPWRFAIHLTFNYQGKIIHQVDWINYTPKENFLGGRNMNTLPSNE